MKRIFLYVLYVLPLFVACKTSQEKTTIVKVDKTAYVNPFVGTDGPGNTYPGAVVPFGMVQVSPDNGLPGWDRIAGYFWPDSTIAGFSHKHLTGTGAGDLYDILVMPYNSRFTDDLWQDQKDYRPYSKFSHKQESASPGYYSVNLLSSGIKAEITATERVGMHRYTFPKDKESKILIDLGYHLNWDSPTDTYMEQKDSVTLVGYRYSTGWAPDQREHFVIKLSRPIEKIDFYSDGIKKDKKVARGKNTKAEITFNTKDKDVVLLKVALSSHSVEGAEKNLNAECPGWDFDEVVKEANSKWQKKLDLIDVEGTDYQKRVFYTNLYHCFLTPSLHSDVDGWYKGVDGKMHQAKGYNKYDTFSIWDTYRTAHPLYTIIVPQEVRDMVQSCFSHYDETGLLPVWSFVGNETNMMIGYHSVPVIVDAYFKGIPMDQERAYNACVATAKSDAWSLPDYKKYGYVPMDDSKHGHWSVSETLEYAYDDWCVALFAKSLGKNDDYAYFSKRANNWKNLFDKKTGFFRPKSKDGSFIKHFIPKEYTEYFCESNAWQYLWSVQHDIQGLIKMEGNENFAAKLDSMFTYENAPDDKLPIFSTGMIGQYAHGNEPSHHVAYLFNEIDHPEKTQKLVRRIIESQYTDKPDGYCGNEDCGQMSAWLVMSSLGLYPVNPANGVYDLTSPWMKNATIHLSNGKTFEIKVQKPGENDVLIDKVFLNGKELNDLKITHKQLMAGGELLFVLK